MPPLIEINIKAKRKEEPSKVQFILLDEDGQASPYLPLVLEVGKCYRNNNGYKIGPLQKLTINIDKFYAPEVGWFEPNGVYSSRSWSYYKSLVQEDWEYWKEERIFMLGGAQYLEYKVRPELENTPGWESLKNWVSGNAVNSPVYNIMLFGHNIHEYRKKLMWRVAPNAILPDDLNF